MVSLHYEHAINADEATAVYKKAIIVRLELCRGAHLENGEFSLRDSKNLGKEAYS